MVIECKYNMWQKVFIPDLDGYGIIDTITLTGSDIQYGVRVWTNGELKCYTLWENEMQGDDK